MGLEDWWLLRCISEYVAAESGHRVEAYFGISA